jgi:hypothetical protein
MRNAMYGQPLLPPQNERGPAAHNGLAITAFVTAWVMPPVGFILGAVSCSEAHKNGRHESGLAVWAIILGFLFTAIAVIAIAVAIHSAGQAASQLGNCDINNPLWPNC